MLATQHTLEVLGGMLLAHMCRLRLKKAHDWAEDRKGFDAVLTAYLK
jgi:hypothetical protein